MGYVELVAENLIKTQIPSDGKELLYEVEWCPSL